MGVTISYERTVVMIVKMIKRNVCIFVYSIEFKEYVLLS